MDPYIQLPSYNPPGQVYSGPSGGEKGMDLSLIQKIVRDEILAQSLLEKSRLLEQKQAKLESEMERLSKQSFLERIGNQAAHDRLKQDLFDFKITPVPAQEQLTNVERDQLDFFLKSPGIGMFFLSTAFYIAKADLGDKVRRVASDILGGEAMGAVKERGDLGGKVGGALADARAAGEALLGAETMEKVVAAGTQVRKLSESASRRSAATGDAESGAADAAADMEDRGTMFRLLRPGRIALTVLMPLLLLGVQFAYIFFIFKEGYDRYASGVCPGFDVPANNRHDPGFGADTQVRVLVGFIGAYFVFKNVSQLIQFQRALRGNLRFKPPPAAAAAAAAGGLGPATATVVMATAAADPIKINGPRRTSTGGLAATAAAAAAAAQSDEGSLRVADTSSWLVQDVTASGMYPVYCLDLFVNLSLVFLVLLCNLYVVFVTGAGAQDVVTKVVILDFILMQQTQLKRELFSGGSGHIVLESLRRAYEFHPPNPALARRNFVVQRAVTHFFLFLGQFPILVSAAFIMYGPICKPGIDAVAALAIKTSRG